MLYTKTWEERIMFNLDASYMKLVCLQKRGWGGKLSKILREEWYLTILVRQNNNFIKTKSSYFAFWLLFQPLLYFEVESQDFMCVKMSLFWNKEVPSIRKLILPVISTSCKNFWHSVPKNLHKSISPIAWCGQRRSLFQFCQISFTKVNQCSFLSFTL